MAIKNGTKWGDTRPDASPLNKPLVWNQFRSLQSIGKRNAKSQEEQLATDEERVIYMQKVIDKEISLAEMNEIAGLWKPLTIDLPMVLCQAYNETTGARRPVPGQAATICTWTRRRSRQRSALSCFGQQSCHPHPRRSRWRLRPRSKRPPGLN
jgi:hypothetical protein